MAHNGLPDITGSPSIKIGERALTLRWSQLAQFELSEAGYTPLEMLNAIIGKDPKALAYSYRMFAAMVAHNFVDSKEAAPDARYWASILPNERFAELCEVVREALIQGKALVPVVQLREPATKEAEPPETPAS